MMNTKVASLSDVEEIVEIHCNAFPDFFLTSLGRSFLIFYYTCFIKNKNGIVVCIEHNDKLLGFSATTKQSKGFNSNLIKSNLMNFCFLAVKLLLFNPKALIRLVKNIAKTSNEISDTENYAELFSIGVIKDGQGKGIGKKLLCMTEDILKLNHISRLSLTTDYYNNEKVILFYKSLKFEVLYEFITYPNRKMYRLIKNI